MMAYGSNSRAFVGAFRETLTAHVAGVGGIIAGLVVAWQLNVFERFPWGVAVYPSILVAMDTLSGLFSGRLNTALHIGTIYPRLLGNTQAFRRVVATIMAIIVTSGFVMSAFSIAFGGLFWGVRITEFPNILIVVVATMNLGLIFSLFALVTTFAAFRKGLDLDSFAYPVIVAIGGIFITVCYAFAVNLFFDFGSAGQYLVLLVAAVPVAFTLYLLPRNIHGEGFARALKQSMVALIFVGAITSVAGTVLRRIDLITSSNKNILIAYPALVELAGDATLVIGSVSTAGLALGLFRPSFSSIKEHAPQICGVWAASLVLFTLFSGLTLFITGTLTYSTLSAFTSVLLLTNVIAMVVLVLTSFGFAILTFEKGLDPDHFVMPIESALAAAVTSIALLASLLLIG